MSLENVVLFICQVWVNVDNLLLIKIHILENHSLKPYFGLVSSMYTFYSPVLLCSKSVLESTITVASNLYD